MKKIILTSIALLSIVALASCSSNAAKSESATEETKTEQAVTKKIPSSLEDFKMALEDSGLVITKEQEKEPAMIQAKKGIGYVLDDGSSVEIFEFDDNDMFKSIKKDKELLGIPATIKENYVIIIVNDTTHQPEIDEALATFR